MKRIVLWIMTCLLMAGLGTAHALTGEEALEKVSGYLTEVYSYTTEDAEKFEAYAELIPEGWYITYWHQDHPEWAYSAVYHSDNERLTNTLTPFYHNDQYDQYPGEGSVREGLNRARKNGWFVIWEDHMRQELVHYMKEWGITPTQRLSEGLSTGKITPGNALHEYFVSCYGDQLKWTPALKQWHDAEMEYYGFTLTDDEPVTEGIITWKDTGYNDLEVEMTRFIGEVPEALKEAFSHPKLEGWTCLCGATAQNAENRFGYGIAVFEKEGIRLLTALRCEADGSGWWISPVSEQALYTDRKLYILPESADSKNRFTIVYDVSDSETEKLNVSVGNMDDKRLDVFVNQYFRMDEATGNGLMIQFDSAVKAIVYENHRKKTEEQSNAAFSTAMSMLDMADFPTSLEELKAFEQELIPEGYALVRGVHLRQKTSSRSKDLGEYNAGVLAKVLGTEPGDPWMWYHVQIGRAEGYMASSYVDEAVNEKTAYVINHVLPVAQARKELKLRKGMSRLSGTVQTVPEGTQMHVLADCDGGWLHVSIPQGAFSWNMDLNGTDGYVREKDVKLGGTPIALEWSR